MLNAKCEMKKGSQPLSAVACATAEAMATRGWRRWSAPFFTAPLLAGSCSTEQTSPDQNSFRLMIYHLVLGY